MKLWAIFSIDNEYYQPTNNLQMLFEHKPSFEQLAWFLYPDKTLDQMEENELINTVNMLQLKEVNKWEVNYRLEEVVVGERLEQRDY